MLQLLQIRSGYTILVEKLGKLAGIDDHYKIHELKRQCPDAEVLCVIVSVHTGVEDQISTPKVTIFLSSVIVS